MATHWLPPKTLQEGHKKQPCNPTHPALMVEMHSGEQAHHICTKPQQFCMSAACHLEVTPCFAFLLFTGLILSSFGVTPAHLCSTFCSCLSPLLLAHHHGHTSDPQGDNCVIPHQMPASKEKHVVAYSGAFTRLQASGTEAWPGQTCWSPGRSRQTGASTAHRQVPSSAVAPDSPQPLAEAFLISRLWGGTVPQLLPSLPGEQRGHRAQHQPSVSTSPVAWECLNI